MLTIDPMLGRAEDASRPSEDGGDGPGRGGLNNSEVGNMKVLQDVKVTYKMEGASFLARLKPFLQVKFGAAIDETRKALEQEKFRSSGGVSGKARLDPRNHEIARVALWKYAPIMLFSKEVSRPDWQEILKMYEGTVKVVYEEEFRDAVYAWKQDARTPTHDEKDLLFTSHQEKKEEGLTSSLQRNATVKLSRTKTTITKTFKVGEDGSRSKLDSLQDGKPHPYEVFGLALDGMVRLICIEQNFVSQFFHLSSVEQIDFFDAVSVSPDTRNGVDLSRLRIKDPDLNTAKQLTWALETLFSFFKKDMSNFVEWSLEHDPL